jgi:hypothetical protein
MQGNQQIAIFIRMSTFIRRLESSGPVLVQAAEGKKLSGMDKPTR